MKAVSWPAANLKLPKLSSVPLGMAAGLIVMAGFRTALWCRSREVGGQNDTTREKPAGAGLEEQKLPVVTLARTPYLARSSCSRRGFSSTCCLIVSVAVPLVLRVRVNAAVRIVPVTWAEVELSAPDRPRPSTVDPAAATAVIPAVSRQ